MKLGNTSIDRVFIGNTLIPYINLGKAEVFGSRHYKRNDLIEVSTSEINSINCSAKSSDKIVFTGNRGTDSISLIVVDRNSTNLSSIQNVNSTVSSTVPAQGGAVNAAIQRFFTPVINGNYIYLIGGTKTNVISTMYTNLYKINLTNFSLESRINLGDATTTNIKTRPAICMCDTGSGLLMGGYLSTYAQASIVDYTYSLGRGTDKTNSSLYPVHLIIPSIWESNKKYLGIGNSNMTSTNSLSSLYLMTDNDIVNVSKRLTSFVCLTQSASMDFAVTGKNTCIQSDDFFSKYTELDPEGNPFKKKGLQITKCVAYGNSVFFGGGNGMIAEYDRTKSKFVHFELFPTETTLNVSEMTLDETNKIIYVCCGRTIAKYYIDKIA